MKVHHLLFIGALATAIGISVSVGAKTSLQQSFSQKKKTQSLGVITNKELRKEAEKSIQASKDTSINGSEYKFNKKKMKGFVSLKTGEICAVKSELIKTPPAPGQGQKVKKQVGVHLDCVR